jgi:uncharacterized protein (DUF924 family)
MTDRTIATEVLGFWFGDETGVRREAWFEKNSGFDAEIRERFGAVLERAMAGELDGMATTPRGCLALVIVMDQFPRNIYRDDGRAFATDGQALALAKSAIEAEFDQQLTPLEREFLYLPFEHSEDLDDQHRSVELFATLGADALEWAERHLAVIERFGRFPHRNAALGRETTEEEAAFLEEKPGGF